MGREREARMRVAEENQGAMDLASPRGDLPSVTEKGARMQQQRGLLRQG